MRGPDSRRWAVFLDRDGTLNAHVMRDGRRTSPRDVGEWVPVPGSLAAIAALRHAGARVAVVTNQPDLDRGLIDGDRLTRMHERLGPLDAVYICPHTAARRCPCRKPSSHWLHRAAEDLSVSLTDSYLVGDRATDAQTGLNAGLRTVLLAPRRSASAIPGLEYAAGLRQAAQAILHHRLSVVSHRKEEN